MNAGRDLSGFRDPPRRSVDVAPPPPPAPRRSNRTPRVSGDAPSTASPSKRVETAAGASAGTERPGIAARDRRRKVMVAIAADVHRRLRAEADRRGVFKADVVFDGYLHHAEALRSQRNGSGAGPASRASRRKAVEDATQCQLYLTNSERDQIDSLARDIGVSRSDLVSQILGLELREG